MQTVINDQRAYQAATNLIQLHVVRAQRIQLKATQDRLSQEIIETFNDQLVPDLACAIKAGWSMLAQGKTFEQAKAYVIDRLQTPPETA